MMIYLDYAATTPVDPAVARKMAECLTQTGNFGNPASVSHAYGQLAARAIAEAAEQVATVLHADPEEIVWTSGATEANNLALKGIAHFHQHKGKHIVTARTEHKSVLDSCRQLEKLGFEVTYLTPQANGIISPGDVEAALRADTILVSIMHVNNETGVIQDLYSIAECVKQSHAFFHVDAAQSAGKIPIDLRELPIDLLSLSAHKVYGPKGIGALYVRRKPPVKLMPQIQGGGQQRGMRSGTLPTHQIAGMGAAFELAGARMDSDRRQAIALQAQLLAGLTAIPDIALNTDTTCASPFILNLSVRGVPSNRLLNVLGNVAIAAGSACDSSHMEPSYVLKSMGLTTARLDSAIRISLGRYTTAAEIEQAAAMIAQAVELVRG